MSASIAFDNTGAPYDPSVIIQNGLFDLDAYRSYSPAFVTVTFALAYGVSFASVTSVIVHIFRESVRSS